MRFFRAVSDVPGEYGKLRLNKPLPLSPTRSIFHNNLPLTFTVYLVTKCTVLRYVREPEISIVVFVNSKFE